MRPCAHPGCPTPTTGTRCPAHGRDPNLARDVLPWIIRRDRNICYLCGQPCGPRGRSSDSPTIEHVNGDVTDNTLSNLRLAHHSCNNTKH